MGIRREDQGRQCYPQISSYKLLNICVIRAIRGSHSSFQDEPKSDVPDQITHSDRDRGMSQTNGGQTNKD